MNLLPKCSISYYRLLAAKLNEVEDEIEALEAHIRESIVTLAGQIRQYPDGRVPLRILCYVRSTANYHPENKCAASPQLLYVQDAHARRSIFSNTNVPEKRFTYGSYSNGIVQNFSRRGTQNISTIKVGKLSEPYKDIGDCLGRAIKDEGMALLWRAKRQM